MYNANEKPVNTSDAITLPVDSKKYIGKSFTDNVKAIYYMKDKKIPRKAKLKILLAKKYGVESRFNSSLAVPVPTTLLLPLEKSIRPKAEAILLFAPSKGIYTGSEKRMRSPKSANTATNPFHSPTSL